MLNASKESRGVQEMQRLQGRLPSLREQAQALARHCKRLEVRASVIIDYADMRKARRDTARNRERGSKARRAG